MEITGSIDMWGCPIFECSVANTVTMQKVSVKTVIDTGAFNYCLKQRLIDALQLPVISSIEILHPTDGKKPAYKYRGAIEFTFGILTDIVILPIIVESYEHDFIIGTDFLKQRSFSYDSLKSAWRIYW